MSTRSPCSRQTFKWSEKQLTVCELVDCYRDQLPFPIIMTSGWQSGDDVDWTISKDDVYWAHTITEEQRIIVCDGQGQRYKIPERYDATVIPIKADGKAGAPFPFCEVRERGEYRYIRFVESKQEVYTDLKGERRFCDLGDLSVIDVCDDVFVAIHSLRMEHMLEKFSRKCQDDTKQQDYDVVSPAFTLLPANAPVTLSLGVALARAPDVIYFHTLVELKALVDSYQNNYTHQLKHRTAIVLENEKCNDNNYESVDAEDENIQKQLSQFRKEPLATSLDINPEIRMKELRSFYKTRSLSKVAVDISHLDAEGYLNPVTWLAVEENETNQRVEASESGAAPSKDEAAERNSVSLLRKCFEEAATEQYRTLRPKKIAPLSTKLKQIEVPVGPAPVKPNPRQVVSPPLRQFGSSGSSVNSSSSVKTAVVSPIRVFPTLTFQPKETKRIADVQDLPDDISHLGIGQVMECLRCLNLSDYIPQMRAGLVDGRLLLCLKEQDLIKNFGFSEFEATKLMQFAKHGWRPKS